jgi:copper chaperone CopZ
MKRAILAAVLMLAPAMSLAGEAETRLHVTGLTCPSCSYIVATALKKVESVKIAAFTEGEAEDGTYLLRYDDAVTDPEALIAAVTGVGYGAALAPGEGS